MRLEAKEDSGNAYGLGVNAGLSVRALQLVVNNMLGKGTMLRQIDR